MSNGDSYSELSARGDGMGMACGIERGPDCDGYEPTDHIDWLNHVAVHHDGEEIAECDICGREMDWTKEYAPEISFAGGELNACMGCQNEVWRHIHEEMV